MKMLLTKLAVPCAVFCLVGTAYAVPIGIDAANAASNGFSLDTTDNTGAPGGLGSFGFVNCPAAPPVGLGSLNFQTPPGNGDQALQLRFSGFLGTSLSSITTLSYSTFAAAFNGAQLPFLTLYVGNTGLGGGGGGDRIFFEPVYTPVQGAVATGVWQTWNVLTGNVITDSTGFPPISWGAYLAANPLAFLVNDPNPTFAGTGGIRFASGNSGPGDNFNTNMDNFTFNSVTSRRCLS